MPPRSEPNESSRSMAASPPSPCACPYSTCGGPSIAYRGRAGVTRDDDMSGDVPAPGTAVERRRMASSSAGGNGVVHRGHSSLDASLLRGTYLQVSHAMPYFTHRMPHALQSRAPAERTKSWRFFSAPMSSTTKIKIERGVGYGLAQHHNNPKEKRAQENTPCLPSRHSGVFTASQQTQFPDFSFRARDCGRRFLSFGPSGPFVRFFLWAFISAISASSAMGFSSMPVPWYDPNRDSRDPFFPPPTFPAMPFQRCCRGLAGRCACACACGGG
jgi:hypothetical protein